VKKTQENEINIEPYKYRAILWLLQGKKRIDIAKELGVKRLAIYKWVKRYNQEGESGLSRRPGQGDKRTLTPDKIEKIKQWVSEEQGIWTLDKMRIDVRRRHKSDFTSDMV
jgi:transposase